MKPVVTIAIVAGAILLFCQNALAQTANAQQTQHLCTAPDLVHGTWKLLVLQETPPGEDTSWIEMAPYHYLSFSDANNYTFIATTYELKTKKQAQDLMTWPLWSHHNLAYRLSDQGVLDLYIDNVLKYHYRCLMIDKANGQYRKGDLVLTAYTNNYKSYLYKWYRRWY